MKFFAHVADAADEDGLHVHMDVLSLFVESHFACFDVVQDFTQCFHNEVCVLLGDDALFAQHGCVCHTAGDVLVIHAAVKADGGMEMVCEAVCGFGEASAPKFLHKNLPFYVMGRKPAISSDKEKMDCSLGTAPKNLWHRVSMPVFVDHGFLEACWFMGHV